MKELVFMLPNKRHKPAEQARAMDELPPVNPVDVSAHPTHTTTHIPKPSLVSRINWRIVAIVLIVIMLIGVWGWWYLTQRTPSTPEATTDSSQSEVVIPPAPTEPLLTYIGKNSSMKTELLVTNSTQKQIATLALSEGKTNFRIHANNWDTILVEEYAYSEATPNDTAKNFYQITNKGDVSKLSDATAKNLAKAVGRVALGLNNSALYITCEDAACNLVTLDLKTGKTEQVTSVPRPNTANSQAQPVISMELLGTTWAGDVYIIAHEDPSKPGTVRIINSLSGKTLSEHPLAETSLNTPNISNDGSKLVYTAASDNRTILIMDIQSGKSERITPEVPAGPSYIWSPDNSTAAFVAEAGSLDAVSTVRVATVSSASKEVKIIYDYGVRGLNTVQLGGWSTDILLHLTHSITTTPNDFSNAAPTLYALDIQSGGITTDPLPFGYALVSPQ